MIFRLGRLLGAPKGPGLFFLIPIVDRMVRIDLRTITLNVPPQEVITKDNVPARVNAVAYFRIVDPSAAVVQVENYLSATSQIAQTTLRSTLGQHVLDELLSEREKINAILQGIIDEQTAPWGIKVSVVEVKDVEIPSGMQRAMARQAEAERERRAKVIAAEGEFQAAERLKDAALVIEEHPVALQLRYLQTLIEVSSAAGSSTIVFPLPLEFYSAFMSKSGARLSGELRRDPISGREVVIAPARAGRPGAGRGAVEPPSADELERCPFCEGREDRTPPETFAVAPGPRRAGHPGLVGARRPEPLSRARAAGGGDLGAEARALARRAGRRRGRADRRGLARPRGRRDRGGLRLRAGAPERGPRGGREPPALAHAARLDPRGAAGGRGRADADG